jgi:coproporphyrinogen III oxidase-like Fe-S oxidoreductase
MACNSTLCAKIFLDYQIDEEFLQIAEGLSKHRISIGIRTFDPNINKALSMNYQEIIRLI